MGKNKFASMIIAVVVIFASYNVWQAQKSSVLSDLVLANVEALADNNESNSQCDNINGYRQWNINHGFLEREKKFYDCCSNMQVGYSPSGTCSR